MLQSYSGPMQPMTTGLVGASGCHFSLQVPPTGAHKMSWISNINWNPAAQKRPSSRPEMKHTHVQLFSGLWLIFMGWLSAEISWYHQQNPKLSVIFLLWHSRSVLLSKLTFAYGHDQSLSLIFWDRQTRLYKLVDYTKCFVCGITTNKTLIQDTVPGFANWKATWEYQ